MNNVEFDPSQARGDEHKLQNLRDEECSNASDEGPPELVSDYEDEFIPDLNNSQDEQISNDAQLAYLIGCK